MIDTLRTAGAAVIAYDIEFLERTPEDAALRRAIERAGPQLLLAATRIDSEGQGEILGGPAEELPASAGYAGFPISADGAYREVDESVGLSGADRSEPGTRRLESFAVVAAALAGEPAERFERAWIDYHGPARTFPHVPFADVLEGVDPRRFEGKVVVVGTSARKQGDLHATAAGDGRVMSGAEIQANAISTLRRGTPLEGIGAAGDLALIVLLGLLPAVAAIALRPRLAALMVVAAAGVYVAAAQLLFSAGLIVPVLYPLLALGLSAAGVFAARAAGARRLSRAG
jgi:CHASE2 domain-containing sensor protein